MGSWRGVGASLIEQVEEKLSKDLASLIQQGEEDDHESPIDRILVECGWASPRTLRNRLQEAKVWHRYAWIAHAAFAACRVGERQRELAVARPILLAG
jgi:hypothetical protein